jgi:hypothetical protein
VWSGVGEALEEAAQVEVAAIPVGVVGLGGSTERVPAAVLDRGGIPSGRAIPTLR